MTTKNEVTKKNRPLSILVAFIILMVFWVIFSGQFDLFHLSLGVMCCLVVAYFSHDLLIENINSEYRVKKSINFILYLPWLIYQVILANFHVVRLVLDPRDIDPQIVRVKSKLKSDFSMVAFANSITLTPGTITMDIVDGEFVVHALSQKVADDLNSGDMENRIADIFLENDNEKQDK